MMALQWIGSVFTEITASLVLLAAGFLIGRYRETTKLPASAHASPMTFTGNTSKKQFVVIAAGGGNKYNQDFSDALVAYTLP